MNDDDAVYETYTPKPCIGDDAKFSGEVVLRLPTYDENLEIVSKHPELAKELDPDDDSKQSELYNRLLIMARYSYKFIHKVDIKRKSDGKHFQRLAELKVSKDCRQILQDIGLTLIQGVELGK